LLYDKFSSVRLVRGRIACAMAFNLGANDNSFNVKSRPEATLD